MMVRRSAFAAVGGYTEGFFMYYDDVDLSWRMRLAGWEVLFCPRGRTTHDYEFEKGSYKWRYLERNRWWCVLAHLQARTLLLLLPLLVAVELAVWQRAAREGWRAAKRDSWRLIWRDRHALATRRREIQASRLHSDRVIVERMRGEVDSPFLSSPLLDLARPLLQAYRSVVLRVTR
jgi:GT2 family glycosyltransferase